jgi:hypothetical protein
MRAILIAFLLQLAAPACDPTASVDPNDQRNLVPGVSLIASVSTITASAASWSEIDLAWQTSPSASGYQIFRSTTGATGSYAQIGSVSGNTSRYADVGLTASSQYCYEVRSFKYTGKTISYGAFSSAACATTLPPPIVAPSEIDAVPQEYRILVKWKDNSDNEDGFRVEAFSAGQPTEYSTVPANTTSTYFYSYYLLAEQQWCFRVYAFSAVASIPSTTTDCTTVPASPRNLSATPLDAQSITLDWTDNSAVEDGYKVYRSENGGSFTEIATLPPNSVTYSDVGVQADVGYTYHVQAVKDGGYSYVSNDAYVVIPTTVPAAPTNTDIGFGYDYDVVYLYVSWTDASTNEAGFRIEFSESNDPNNWYYYTETGANVTSFTDQYPPYGAPSDLCIRVIAFNALGDSPPSNVSCATLDPSQIYYGGLGELRASNNDLTLRIPTAGSRAKGLKSSVAVVPNHGASAKQIRVKRTPRFAPPTRNMPPTR